MTNINSKMLIGFSLLDALFWAFIASFTGFIATYLLACGMTSSFLSILLAMYMLCAFLGAFFWGGQCDKHRTNRKIFIPEFLIAVVFAVVIFFTAKISLWIPTVLYPLFGFLAAPLGSNLDAWMLKSFHQDAGAYGKARSIGSAGYAIAALVVGFLISGIGYIVMPIAAVSFAVLILILAFFMKEEAYGTKVQHVEPQNPTALLKIAPYMFLIVILFLTGLASSPVNNLKIVIIQSVGGDVSILGIDSFIGVMIQAAFIFFSGKMKKIPPYLRLFLMSLFVMMDMVLIFTASNPMMVILGSVMWNASYGLMLPTMREITEANVTGALKNTAHAMTDAVYGSFAGILALLYSGTLMDSFGARSVALLGFVIMLIPVCMAGIAYLKHRKHQS